MKLIRLDVTSERITYPVLIGPGAVRSLPSLLLKHGIGPQRLLISSAPIWRLQGQTVRALLPRRTRPLLMADGERAKTLATVAAIYDVCLARGLDRGAAVIAFGGGVVGDVAGFAAATYLRGVRLIQIPTTLLAQVDSAIGGKVGVNLPSGKNLVGSFHPPTLVVCDPDMLATLSRREFRAGLYEVVKYGMIASRPLFRKVQQNLGPILDRNTTVLTSVVAACCRIKADVVMGDEREAGPRRALNFGHTIGHALESITSYKRFRHGEAVGYGMAAAARLSVLRGALAEAEEAELATLLRSMGRLPPVKDLRISDALDVIGRDKKVVAGRLHFVLAAGIGSTVIVSDVHTRELTQVMRSLGMRP